MGGDYNTVISSMDYQGSKYLHSNAKAREILSVLMEDFSLCDIWRNFHPSVKQYTRHQKNPRALSRLIFIFISSNFIGNCNKAKIIPGMQDHSIVFVQFNDNQPVKGRGFFLTELSLFTQ